MMKILAGILAFIAIFFQTGQLDKIREQYAGASASATNSAAFSRYMNGVEATDAVTRSYKSAAKIIEAKFAKGEARKTLLKNGIGDLERKILLNPNNYELRIIRLSVQENLPKIVGYGNNMKDDKKFLVANYSKQNNALKSYTRKFVSSSKTFSAAEKAQLK